MSAPLSLLSTMYLAVLRYFSPSMYVFAKPSSAKQKCGLVAHIEPKSVVIEICGYIPELRDYVRTTPFIHWKNNGGIWQLQIDAPIGENLLSFTNAMATINQPVSVMEKTGASPISVY